MSTIGKLLGKSPFGLLQRHMEQVSKCVVKMEESLSAFEQGNWDEIEPLADQVSRLEHQADQIKDETYLYEDDTLGKAMGVMDAEQLEGAAVRQRGGEDPVIGWITKADALAAYAKALAEISEEEHR